ncbi:hypothetical protein ASF61_04400 [Duganella sp. Leaf126]|uniref:helix-turn-helix domain-containing protein n=1 Tax=Duganella sp. Leaf126 TaxID=1736266 RepID=UPI0006FB6B4C|nr:helix-turn-helix domain-containing protein [Duganella sp. Leaf126]KQQ40046.1 hypothetical protein ASF61_04400 [Duganella sp. Leaf126]
MEAQDTFNALGAATLLHADVETVLALARKGELPGTKIGKSWVFLRTDILDFLRERVRHDTAQRLQSQRAASPAPAALLVPRPASRKRRELPVLPLLPEPPTLSARAGTK